MILQAIKKLFKKEKIEPIEQPEKRERHYDWHVLNDKKSSDVGLTPEQALEQINEMVFQRTIADVDIVVPAQKTGKNGQLVSTFDKAPVVAQDNNIQDAKARFGIQSFSIQQEQLMWFANQSFIGYQACAILAQNWLVNKACSEPAEDAVRKGFEITVNSGVEISPDIINKIKDYDKEFKLVKNLKEFVYFGRMFGIRIAMFAVKSDDPLYYERPFNIDGVTPGSYKGIIQIDLSWLVPQLDLEASGAPDSQHFYEPTFWMVNGKRVHRSHIVIFRGKEVADVLKPSYYFGGIPIPQQVFYRVYCAERTANEAPMLAATKRTLVQEVDVAQALANQSSFETRLQLASYYRNNYGTQVVGKGEKITQLETSLADLDDTILTHYQLVASAAEMPVTKLLGTVPKGWN